MRRSLIFLLVLLLPVIAFSQTSPLIMKHADSLAVARKRGTLILHGRVHFVHDSVQFRTQRAVWNKDNEVVQCDGGFKFTHPNGYVNADKGIYQKKDNIAIATGKVNAGDSAHTYLLKGEHLVYNRKDEILDMPKDPHLWQFEKKKDGTEDTLSVVAEHIVYNKKDGVAQAHEKVVIMQQDVTISADHMKYTRQSDIAEAYDHVTLTQKDVTIFADKMNYNKKDDFAEAFNHVKMTQKDMVVTCDTGYFDRKNNWVSMKGHPTCDLKGYHLTGDSIFLVLDSTGNSLKSALVIRNAHGVQQEEPKGRTPGRVTEATGDTLFAQFKNNKIEHLYVNQNAHGTFYETDLKDYRNLMDGDRLDMFFKKGKMDHAVVSGKAQSTYFYVKNDRSISGKNEATGDTIHITFDAQKNAVKSLRLLGSSAMASGRYVDMEKESRNKAAAKKDSLAQLKEKSDIKKDDVPVIKRGRRREYKNESPVEEKH
ncbi:MAG: LPS export ABC transporter periplasmic protein LptC [Fibrobacter sp.]|nr:LPS export ABC transporter periplasmic protein LptC [Fibrobacter sp.]